MKDQIKPIKVSTTPHPLKIKEGRVKIILTDQNGHEEVVEDHNMMTDAIQQYMASCGWLNRDNLDQSTLVPDLFGGVMLFDGEVDEERTTLSEGLTMIANGGLGVTNAGTPYELGTCSDVASETGWQDDGSYLFTYRWDETHGNCPVGKSIASVCLVPKWYGICGEGNHTGEYSASSSGTPRSFVGTPTSYSVTGEVCKVDITNSECYAVDLSDVANGNITIRKYRIPTRKINLKGTPTAPIVLSEITIPAPQSLVTEWNTSLFSHQIGTITANNDKLYLFSVNHTFGGTTSWGTSYTQYMWTIDPIAETATETVLLNSTGESLWGIELPIFIDSETFAFVNGYYNYRYNQNNICRYVYVYKLVSGSWVFSKKYENPAGATSGGTAEFPGIYGWGSLYHAHDGRALIYTGQAGSIQNKAVVLDTVAEELYITNAGNNPYSNAYKYDMVDTDIPLIRFVSNGGSVILQRDSAFLSTIFNLSQPVTKDATRTMTLIYRLTFEEEEENA